MTKVPLTAGDAEGDTMNRFYADKFETRQNLQILEKLPKSDIKSE